VLTSYLSIEVRIEHHPSTHRTLLVIVGFGFVVSFEILAPGYSLDESTRLYGTHPFEFSDAGS
jgi:hypothetical protein